MDRDEFVISRDVVFREDVFPYATKSVPATKSVKTIQVEDSDEDWNFNFSPAPVDPVLGESSSSVSPAPVDSVDKGSSSSVSPALVDSVDRGSLPVVSPPPASSTTTTSGGDDSSHVVEERDVTDEVVTTGAADLTDGTSGLQSADEVPYVKLRDYVTYNTEARNISSTHHAPIVAVHQTSSSVQGNTLYPLTKYVCDSNFSPQQQVFLAAITAGFEPKHLKEAVGIDVWDESMTVEIVALEGQHTWDICDLPPGKTALGSQWVYKIKYNTDGTIRRHSLELLSWEINK